MRSCCQVETGLTAPLTRLSFMEFFGGFWLDERLRWRETKCTDRGCVTNLRLFISGPQKTLKQTVFLLIFQPLFSIFDSKIFKIEAKRNSKIIWVIIFKNLGTFSEFSRNLLEAKFSWSKHRSFRFRICPIRRWENSTFLDFVSI